MPECPLCGLVINEIDPKTGVSTATTPIIHQDSICTLSYSQQNDKEPIVTLNSHKKAPSYKELDHIRQICLTLYPEKKLRGYPPTVPGHWHEHLI